MKDTGPRNRAPLGIKTTNAKALQTPAAPATQDKVSSSKPTSPRLRRSKIKIHEAISTEAENVLLDPEDREIEYMPPREVPLPDYPEDIWPHDRTYPQLEGENLTRGWWSEYAPKNRGHGDEGETSDFEELCKKAGFRANKNAIQSTSSNPAPTNPNLTATKAVTALASKPLKPSGFAAPTAATKSRHTAIGSSAGSKKPAQVLGNQRFAAAKAASNSTIGYSKGRAVSASSRMRLPETHSQPGTTFNPNPQAEKRPTLDDVLYLGLLGGGAGSSENTELFGAMGDSDVLAEDEALENFQLDLGE